MFEAGEYVEMMAGDWRDPMWETVQVDEKLPFGKYSVRFLDSNDTAEVDCSRLRGIKAQAGQCLSPACSCEGHDHPLAGR